VKYTKNINEKHEKAMIRISKDDFCDILIQCYKRRPSEEESNTAPYLT